MKKCGLIIGHSSSSQGASNVNGTTEYAFNEELARSIQQKIMTDPDAGVTTQIIYRDRYASLPRKINNTTEIDFGIALHCNAFNTKVSGTEVLHYHRSQNGRHLASVLLTRLLPVLNLNNRGLRPKRSEDRGGYLLRYTHMPMVIAEPFFIDHTPDLEVAMKNHSELVQAYVEAIKEFAGYL